MKRLHMVLDRVRGAVWVLRHGPVNVALLEEGAYARGFEIGWRQGRDALVREAETEMDALVTAAARRDFEANGKKPRRRKR